MSKLRNIVVRRVGRRLGNAVTSAGAVTILLVGGLVAAWMSVWLVHYLAELVRWLPLPSELT